MSTTLQSRLDARWDKRQVVESKRDALVAERGDGEFSDTDKTTLNLYRQELDAIDTEIAELTDDLESQKKAEEASKALVRARLGSTNGVDQDGDGVVYRDFLSFARDQILVRSLNSTGELAKLASNWGGEEAVMAAKSRLELLKRVPATTLTSDIAGLVPAQHIAQIFQVIDDSRPLVNSAQRTTLEKLTLTYPRVDASPVVAVQGTEKTEAGNTGMDISMQTATASTYLGGGNISWQAAQFSTPNALDLWFRLVTADYALKTETDAATVVSASGFLNNIASTIATSATFADFMTAVGAGYAEVYANSGRIADTIYMAPDRAGYLLGLTSAALSQFATVSTNTIGPLNVVISRGLNAGEIIVGDRQGLLVAESAGAPVELRVVEPAIGGFEVGLIGAFEAVVVDDGAFATISTAS